jgi:hypothetical protein
MMNFTALIRHSGASFDATYFNGLKACQTVAP